MTYYADKLGVLADIFGSAGVRLEADRLRVGAASYPVVDDVIVLLPPERRPAGLRPGAAPNAEGPTGNVPGFAPDVQFTFGEEWRRYPRIEPEHAREFAQYFDLVDVEGLRNARVCDLGCGIGRWSHFLRDRCRELVLVDFSDAIFVARKNLAGAGNALFFQADLRDLPFRDDFADFVFSLGVLHHLPTDALAEVRALRRLAPALLVFLYYALDNRPPAWRALLAAVTRLRLRLSAVRDPGARSFLTGLLAVLVYLPLIGLGHAARPFGLERHVPLHAFYAGKSMRRIRQDVYDRFFTRIEQRFTREEIASGLRGAFRDVTIAGTPPYWHFLCRR